MTAGNPELAGAVDYHLELVGLDELDEAALRDAVREVSVSAQYAEAIVARVRSSKASRLGPD